MATIYFSLSKKADFKNLSEIRIRFKHGKIDQQAKTNIFIPTEYWNEIAQQIIVPNFRLMTNEKTELKQYLTDQSKKLNALTANVGTAFNALDKAAITADWLKKTMDILNFPEKYTPKEEKPKITTVFRFIDKFIAEAHTRKDKRTGRLLTYNNIQQYKATDKHLRAFAKEQKKKDFEFDEIDQKFYDKFVAYLQAKTFTQNTVGKQIRVFKLMMNEAQAQGVCNIPSLKSVFYVFTEETDTVYLSETELQKLKDTNFSKTPYLDRVRDWFLLLAWTGCRFSDLSKVAKSDIKDGFISFRQQKTNNKVVIPLHPIVLDILEKYDYDLPTEISNQKFNEYIKEACHLAEINGIESTTRTVGGKLTTETFEKWELVSSHTGRRSFCTNMYKQGLPTLMIMSISGHKTEKAFLKYIKIKQDEHAALLAAKWAEMYKKN
jgi:integrase